LALTATVGGLRPPVSVADVQDYLRRRFELGDDEFDVGHHYTQDFIVRFRHGADRERVLQSRLSGVWLPLVWHPWRRQTLGHFGRFKFKVLVALSRVPMHARNLEVAQTVLGMVCAEVQFSDFRDRPLIADREFFVTAWCWHPSFIRNEQVIYIPELRVPRWLWMIIYQASGIWFALVWWLTRIGPHRQPPWMVEELWPVICQAWVMVLHRLIRRMRLVMGRWRTAWIMLGSFFCPRRAHDYSGEVRDGRGS